MEQVIKIDGLQISKKSVEEVRNEIASKIEDGEMDAVKVMAAVKFYEKVFSGDDKKYNGLTHLIRPHVLTEIEKDKFRNEYYGFKVEIKEAGVRFDYSKCNDSELELLLIEQEEINFKVKERQEFLKSIKGHLDVIQDGEAKTIFPPAKISTTSPVFTLK
jgi:hypothetical protein